MVPQQPVIGGVASPGNMKLIISQQIQNKQLQNKINHLQEQQAQVMSALNNQYFGTITEGQVTQPPTMTLTINPVQPETITLSSIGNNFLANNSTLGDDFEDIIQQQNGKFILLGAQFVNYQKIMFG